MAEERPSVRAQLNELTKQYEAQKKARKIQIANSADSENDSNFSSAPNGSTKGGRVPIRNGSYTKDDSDDIKQSNDNDDSDNSKQQHEQIQNMNKAEEQRRRSIIAEEKKRKLKKR